MLVEVARKLNSSDFTFAARTISVEEDREDEVSESETIAPGFSFRSDRFRQREERSWRIAGTISNVDGSCFRARNAF